MAENPSVVSLIFIGIIAVCGFLLLLSGFGDDDTTRYYRERDKHGED